jgi:predicted transposase YdaD
MEIISSLRKEGRDEGRVEGRVEGKEEAITLLLQKRFSTLPLATTEKLDKLTEQQLNELVVAILDFQSFSDLEDWLARH